MDILVVILIINVNNSSGINYFHWIVLNRWWICDCEGHETLCKWRRQNLPFDEGLPKPPT